MRNSFDYSSFAKAAIDSSSTPILPVSLSRQAIVAGAPHEGEDLRKKLRDACNSLANLSSYRRLRVKGETGYQYMKK